jgi:hypothetical protein
MTKPRHRWRIWSRVATVALLYAFVLAGFVDSIAGPTVHAHANAAYEELCLIDSADGGTAHQRGHSADCCLHGCRVCGSANAPAAQARAVESFGHARVAHQERLPNKAAPPPARIAAAAPLGARGPPSS